MGKARTTPATQAADRAGAAYRLREYDPETAVGPTYGEAAAAALGMAPERVFKTLVTQVDGKALVLAVVPVGGQLDPKALAVAVGAKRAALAEPALAERATGSVVGGISPLGPRRPLPVVIDESAMEHETIVVNGGRRGLQMELAPADLVRACAATVARVAR